jgi:hypothetical protein
MSGSGGEPIDPEQIVGPAIPPPDEADALTAKELKKAKKQPKRVTPTDRIEKSLNNHIDYLKEDCERLRGKNADLQKEVSDLCSETTRIASELATMRQRLHDTRAAFGFAAMAQAAGATLVSIAGATSDLFWKPLCLWGGVTSFVIGFLLGAWALMLIGRGRS